MFIISFPPPLHAAPPCVVSIECDARRGSLFLLVCDRRAAGWVEDSEDAHRPAARVLDRVRLPWGEVEARARANRRLDTFDVRDSLAFDDVADLVVRMTV